MLNLAEHEILIVRKYQINPNIFLLYDASHLSCQINVKFVGLQLLDLTFMTRIKFSVSAGLSMGIFYKLGAAVPRLCNISHVHRKDRIK